MILPTWAVRASRVLDWVNLLARGAYRLGLRRPRRLAVPVVSVGNIAMGGTGKTQLVAAIAADLLSRGARPVVLSRGYRRRGDLPVALTAPAPDWRPVGDEPALLSRAVPGLAIVIDADRVAGGARAIRELAATHVILDDGFQHWRLHRDLDIVLVDARDPLCRWRPRREHPRNLARADAVVVVEPATGGGEDVEMLRKHARGVRIYPARIVPSRVHRGTTVEPAGRLTGERVLAAAGIAEPWRFEATLTGLGATVVASVHRPDHHPWRADEIEALLHAAAAQRATLVVTAKDAVKVPAGLLDHLLWLEVSLELSDASLAELLAPVLPAPSRPASG